MSTRTSVRSKIVTLATVVIGAAALGPWAAPAQAAPSFIASVTAGGVSATVTFSATFRPVSTCNECVGVPVSMTTTGPGTLTMQATAAGSTVPVTGTLTATSAGEVSTNLSVCPGTNGSGNFTVTGTFSAGGETVALPPDVGFGVAAATPTFSTLTATRKGPRTTIAGQALVETSVGMMGATGSVTLSARTPRTAGGTGRWVSLGTEPLSPRYGKFSVRYPATKVPRGSTIRATLVVPAGCTGVTKTITVS